MRQFIFVMITLGLYILMTSGVACYFLLADKYEKWKRKHRK